MLASKLMLCGTCRLAFYPEKKGVAASICPACHHRGWHVPELFHLGLILAAVGLGLAGAELLLGSRPKQAHAARAAVAARPAHPLPSPPPSTRPPDRGDSSRSAVPATGKAPETRARLNNNLQLKAAAGPKRGATVHLRRGERVHVLRKEGKKLLVQDRQGNQVYVNRDDLSTL